MSAEPIMTHVKYEVGLQFSTYSLGIFFKSLPIVLFTIKYSFRIGTLRDSCIKKNSL